MESLIRKENKTFLENIYPLGDKRTLEDFEKEEVFNDNNSDISINSNNTSSYLGKNILARLTLTSGANTIIVDNASDRIFKKREYFGPIKLEKMTVRLLNRYGEVVDMIQNDYSFTLELKQIYSQ